MKRKWTALVLGGLALSLGAVSVGAAATLTSPTTAVIAKDATGQLLGRVVYAAPDEWYVPARATPVVASPNIVTGVPVLVVVTPTRYTLALVRTYGTATAYVPAVGLLFASTTCTGTAYWPVPTITAAGTPVPRPLSPDELAPLYSRRLLRDPAMDGFLVIDTSVTPVAVTAGSMFDPSTSTCVTANLQRGPQPSIAVTRLTAAAAGLGATTFKVPFSFE